MKKNRNKDAVAKKFALKLYAAALKGDWDKACAALDSLVEPPVETPKDQNGFFLRLGYVSFMILQDVDD